MGELTGGPTPAEFLSSKATKVRTSLYGAIRRIDPQFGYRESDVVLSGFPKSGNNWVDFLVANALVRATGRSDDIHFRNVADWVSTSFPRRPPVEGVPRLQTTHDSYGGQETRAVYLLRHPADVMESYHHYLGNRWYEDVGEFSEFIRDDEWGVPAWKRHVESWEGHWDVLVTFEGLKEDSLEQLRNICSLVDREVSEETLQYAVDRSSFDVMKEMEETYGIKRRPGANPDYTFMRKGEADRGVDYFDETDYRYLESVAGDVMDRYGYEIPD